MTNLVDLCLEVAICAGIIQVLLAIGLVNRTAFVVVVAFLAGLSIRRLALWFISRYLNERPSR